MGGYDNYIYNRPSAQPIAVGQPVQTPYGVTGKIMDLQYKSISGKQELYATIFVPTQGGIVYTQAYNAVVFQSNSGGQTSNNSLGGSNL